MYLLVGASCNECSLYGSMLKMLTRGLLQTLISDDYAVAGGRYKFSMPVVVSGLFFGAMHLVLIVPMSGYHNPDNAAWLPGSNLSRSHRQSDTGDHRPHAIQYWWNDATLDCRLAHRTVIFTAVARAH